MEKSQTFYKEQFGFKIDRTKKDPNGEYWICHMKHPSTPFQIELTSYPNGDYADDLKWKLQGEFHLAFYVDNFEEAFKKHKAEGIVVFENLKWNLYFVADPDGNWIEIMKEGK
jgi:lactoylglutathione lyase